MKGYTAIVVREDLAKEMEKTVKEEGFDSRPSFVRYLYRNYVKRGL